MSLLLPTPAYKKAGSTFNSFWVKLYLLETTPMQPFFYQADCDYIFLFLTPHDLFVNILLNTSISTYGMVFLSCIEALQAVDFLPQLSF